jgi:hypothetical protein
MTATSSETDRGFDPVDLSSHAFWAPPATVRADAFAQPRASRPVSDPTSVSAERRHHRLVTLASGPPSWGAGHHEKQQIR